MRIIGLTGGIASGKSTVSRMLRELGACVIDADQLVRAVQEPDGPAFPAILAEFGPRVVTPDGRLDRQALGALIFADPLARRKLEGIVHPLVREQMWAAVEEARSRGEPAVVLDIPLLIEGGLYKLVDEIWVVYTDAGTQLARLMARDGLDEGTAGQRMAAQVSLDEKVRFAHVVIDNRGALDETRLQVARAWRATLAAGGRGGTAGREGP